MKDIKDNLELIRQIAAAAYAAGVAQIELIIALVVIGSGWNPYVAAVDGMQRANLLFARPAGCSPDTETLFQKTRWGLMQILGSVARSLGFSGWLPELVEPELNLKLGVAYLAQLIDHYSERYGIEGVIAAYQLGAPRKIGDKYVNQAYVDAVLKLMATNEELAAKIREMIAAEGMANDTQDTPDGTFVPTVGHTAETLNELTRAQLVELAKSEFDLELSASLSKAKLVTQILVAQADKLDFTAEDLEGKTGVSFAEEDTAVE